MDVIQLQQNSMGFGPCPRVNRIRPTENITTRPMKAAHNAASAKFCPTSSVYRPIMLCYRPKMAQKRATHSQLIKPISAPNQKKKKKLIKLSTTLSKWYHYHLIRACQSSCLFISKQKSNQSVTSADLNRRSLHDLCRNLRTTEPGECRGNYRCS
jgi:hypothetical protein